jgi:hypothetical protein
MTLRQSFTLYRLRKAKDSETTGKFSASSKDKLSELFFVFKLLRIFCELKNLIKKNKMG